MPRQHLPADGSARDAAVVFAFQDAGSVLEDGGVELPDRGAAKDEALCTLSTIAADDATRGDHRRQFFGSVIVNGLAELKQLAHLLRVSAKTARIIADIRRDNAPSIYMIADEIEELADRLDETSPPDRAIGPAKAV